MAIGSSKQAHLCLVISSFPPPTLLQQGLLSEGSRVNLSTHIDVLLCGLGMVIGGGKHAPLWAYLAYFCLHSFSKAYVGGGQY